MSASLSFRASLQPVQRRSAALITGATYSYLAGVAALQRRSTADVVGETFTPAPPSEFEATPDWWLAIHATTNGGPDLQAPTNYPANPAWWLSIH